MLIDGSNVENFIYFFISEKLPIKSQKSRCSGTKHTL